MTARIFRYEVPVDDRWHPIDLQSDVLAVGCRRADAVEFWAWDFGSGDRVVRHEFCVFGTGHPVPDGTADYVGTAVAPGGQLVWHLMRRSPA